MKPYTTFNQGNFDHTKEPMFFGEHVNVSRYDTQKHDHFSKLIKQQLSFFWQPEEVDISKDRRDFAGLPDHEKHIFISNLKYQTLLDSIQGRGPSVAFLPIVSLPELETWVELWSAIESSIHARSYTHIIRTMFDNPTEVLDTVITDAAILTRAADISKYYDDVIKKTIEYNAGNLDILELKRSLYLCMVAVNALEAIRFYVSFACSFAFAERKLMEGNAKIIRLIARDEAVHLSGTQYILKTFAAGYDDPDMEQIAIELKDEAIEIFKCVAEQEKDWAKHLFKDGSMIGLNEKILCEYIEYITNSRMRNSGFEPIYPNTKSNPIPWINSWLGSDGTQTAPQETEQTSYLVGQVNAAVDNEELSEFEL